MKQGIKMCRFSILYLFLFSFLSILYFTHVAWSKIIWQIGNKENGSSEEFNPSDKKVIDYQVPLDWESRIGQVGQIWGEFPYCLYPYNNEAKNPQEIRINLYYLKDYNNPVLIIKASASQRFASQYLEVYKGKDAKEETLISKKPVDLPYYILCDFTLCEIKKGLHEENRIILRNIPRNTFSNTLPIIFDALYLDDNDSDEGGVTDPDEGGSDWDLDDNDSDEDGVTDPDEGDGDWDQDGLPDKLDPDTVCIPIISDDPNIIKRICIDIRESEGESPSFHEVKFLDTNDLNLPNWFESERYLPYGVLGFKIEGIRSKEEILLGIPYRDDLYPSVLFYAYHDSNDWQELAFKYLDNKTVNITLKDGDIGDMDGKKDGSINTALALSYPGSLGIGIEKEGCFLKSLIREP